MFSRPTHAGVARLRLFLSHLEQIENPTYDQETLEAVRKFLRDQVCALEIAEAQESDAAGSAEKEEAREEHKVITRRQDRYPTDGPPLTRNAHLDSSK